MSLAQRRTAPEGINTITELGNGHSSRSVNIETGAAEDQRGHRDSAIQTTPIPPSPEEAEGVEGKHLWQTISYDAFTHQPAQQYEPFLSAETDNLAAYDVSTTKRVGE